MEQISGTCSTFLTVIFFNRMSSQNKTKNDTTSPVNYRNEISIKLFCFSMNSPSTLRSRQINSSVCGRFKQARVWAVNPYETWPPAQVFSWVSFLGYFFPWFTLWFKMSQIIITETQTHTRWMSSRKTYFNDYGLILHQRDEDFGLNTPITWKQLLILSLYRNAFSND